MPTQKVTSLWQSHRPGQSGETKGYLPLAKPRSRAVCLNKSLPPLGKATVQGSMPKQKVASLGQSHRPGQYAETKGYLPWAKPPSRAVCRNIRLPPLGKATVQGSMPKQKVTSLGQSHRPGLYADTKGYVPLAKPPSRAVWRNKRLPPSGKATVQGSMLKQKLTSLG